MGVGTGRLWEWDTGGYTLMGVGTEKLCEWETAACTLLGVGLFLLKDLETVMEMELALDMVVAEVPGG